MEETALEIEEFDSVLKACQSRWYALLIQFWVYSGLRPGEIYSLAWEDIDLTERKVTVQRSMEVKRLDGYPLFKLPKHDKIRTIYLNKAALTALREMREFTQASKRIKIKVYKRSSKNLEDFKVQYVRPVFRRENDHRSRKDIEYDKLWLSHSSWRKIFEAILRRARVNYRSPRQLRHTFACWSLSSRVDITDLRDMLGHTSVTILEKYYAKWMTEAKAKESERNSRLLEEAGFIR